MNAQVLRIKKKQYDDAVRMNTTITPPRKASPAQKRPDPKSFMDSTDFVEIRGNNSKETRAGKGKTKPLAIALKELTHAGKKHSKDKTEEKIGLMLDNSNTSYSDESGSVTPNREEEVESPFSAYRTTNAANAVLTAFVDDAANGGIEEQLSSSV
eukprot:Phypoly_transcript_04291.p3 GENE.Phypoly_transcript_04291~~Phypoly_transcript_04291.p3  ORF type:complete len:155 (+),score=48.30 Phypoly_transcript_04291:1737-2201(+)